MSASRLSDCLVDAELATKGRYCERNQYFLRAAYRALHDRAALLDAQGETTDHGVSITKDVPILRIDHLSAKNPLPGVWHGQRLKAVVANGEMNCSFTSPTLFSRGHKI